MLGELAALRMDLSRQQQELSALNETRSSYWDWLSGLGKNGASALTVKSAEEYAELLSERIGEKRIEIQETEQKIEEKLREVIEASKERKAMERLRENRFEEHKRTAEREELMFLDDLASVRAARQRS